MVSTAHEAWEPLRSPFGRTASPSTPEPNDAAKNVGGHVLLRLRRCRSFEGFTSAVVVDAVAFMDRKLPPAANDNDEDASSDTASRRALREAAM
jgi:hypothetical protein